MDLKIAERLKGREHMLSVSLLVASGLLAVLILAKLVGFQSAAAWAKDLAGRAVTAGSSDANDMEEHLAKSKSLADELKKKNLFAPPQPKQHPVKGVPGILGSEAFINGKWYEEGQSVADAKVVEIKPTQVKVEWEGQEKTFAPLATQGSDDGPGERGPGRRPTRSGGGGPGRVVVQGGGPPRPPGGGPPEDMRQRFADMRERFMNMSEEERREFRERMRGRFGGRGPGGGPPGGFGGRGGRGPR